ncbi:MAG: RNA methyltransferase [Parachlamydiaceae bacterium]
MAESMKRLTSTQHPLVKHLVKLRQNRDYRYEHKSLVIEGIKPVEEIVRHNRLKTIIVYNEASIPLGAEADEIVEVNEAVMRKISGMENPEGLIVEIAMPQPSSLKDAHHVIVLDGINDPGNLGTLLRSALALGWDGAFILGDCCDPFNEKALRAARGATFRLPLGWGDWTSLKKMTEANGLTPLVADVNGIEVTQVKKQDRILLIMGNESHGASKEAKAFGQSVSISMPGAMESLNVAVAGGILMYALRQVSR